MDVLDALAYPSEGHPEVLPPSGALTAREMGIPKEDEALFNQLLNDPNITKLESEIAYLRYLRVKLQESIEARREQKVADLRDKILEHLYDRLSQSNISEAHYGPLTVWMSEVVSEALNVHFPFLDMGVKEAAALRQVVESCGKLVNDWKKVTEGMTININSNEEELFYRMMREIILPAVPREHWSAIAARAEHVAQVMQRDKKILAERYD